MDHSFRNSFDNFLEERLGAEIAKFRSGNEAYRTALNEYSGLINAASRQEIQDYKAAFETLLKLSENIRYAENHYLFLVGLQENKNLTDAISSPQFLEWFTKLETEK